MSSTEAGVRWECPACDFTAKWIAIDDDPTIVSQLLEEDVERHERDTHGIREAS